MPSKKPLFKLTLALACAAAILWLGVGCKEEIDPDYPCGQEALIYANHVREVLKENRRLFARQLGDSRLQLVEHFFRDPEGNWNDEYGIVFKVDKKEHLNTVPPEDRIPDEIDGVTVYVGFPNYSGAREVTYQEVPEFQYAIAVRLKYEDLFFRQPNITLVPYVSIFDDGGRPGEPLSVQIGIYVTKKVDQSTLPPEDRIPDCLEGIPVTIEEIKPNSE